MGKTVCMAGDLRVRTALGIIGGIVLYFVAFAWVFFWLLVAWVLGAFRGPGWGALFYVVAFVPPLGLFAAWLHWWPRWGRPGPGRPN